MKFLKTLAVFLIPLACMTSRKEEALRAEIVHLNSQVDALTKKLQQSGQSLESLKNSTKQVSQDHASRASDIEALKQSLALTQAALDDVVGRLGSTTPGGTTPPGAEEGVEEEPSQEMITHIEERLQSVEKQLTTLSIGQKALLKRAHPTLEGKTAAAMRSRKKKEELTKWLNQLYLDKDFKGVVAAATSLLGNPQQTSMWDTATHLRAEAYFAQGAHDLAYLDFHDLILTYPQHPRAPRAQLLRGDCLVQLQRMAEAKDNYLNIIKQFPKSPEAQAAQERLSQMSLTK